MQLTFMELLIGAIVSFTLGDNVTALYRNQAGPIKSPRILNQPVLQRHHSQLAVLLILVFASLKLCCFWSTARSYGKSPGGYLAV